MPKDKEGNKLTWKEYMKRWKSGIEAITPLQQTKTSLRGQLLVLIGVLWGLYIVWQLPDFKWMFLILIGSLVLTVVGYISLWQKYWALERVDTAMKEMMEAQEEIPIEDKDIEKEVQ